MKINRTRIVVSWVMAVSLALLMLIPFSTAVAAFDTSLSITAPAAAAAGDSFTASVDIGTVTNLNGYQFDLSYDNSVIQVAGDEGGTGLTSGLVGGKIIPLNMWGFVPSGVPGVIRVFGHLAGISTASGQGYLLQIQFNVVGAPGQTSNLAISNLELLDAAGGAISASTAGAVVTVSGPADIIPPGVVSVNPASGALGAAVNTTVSAVFSESVILASGAFTLRQGSTPVAGSVNSSGTAAVFTPAGLLAYNTTYSASLTAGVTDLAGNPLAADYNWSFSTGAQPPAGVLVNLTPPVAEVAQGDIFTATIEVSAVSNFNGYQFDLTYDNSVLQVTGDEGGSAVAPGSIGTDSVPLAMWGFIPAGLPGSVRVLGHLPGVSTADGEGYLAQIQFEVVGSAGQFSELTLSNVELYDNVGDVISSVEVGSIVSVTAIPLEIATSGLPDAVQGSSYSAALAAQGGQGAYSWSASGLPSGLTLSAAGAISGQPSVSGDFVIALTVTDSSVPAHSAFKTLPLHVYPALQIITTALPGGSTAISYSASLAAAGGTGSYTWSAAGLPLGLTLSPAGILSGQTAAAGTFSINLTLSDTFNPPNSVSLTLSLQIVPGGDANGDGWVDMADVTSVERMILGLDPLILGADANGDGSVNMGDVTRIERIILGL